MEYRVVTVTLNPALDVTVWADQLDFDEPVKVQSEKVYAGGKAINVSRVLTSLGVCNKSVGIACQNNYLTLRKLLESDQVDYEFINPQGSIRENLTLCLSDGRVLKVNRTGEAVAPNVFNDVKKLIDKHLSTDTIIAFTGGMPPNCSERIYADLVMNFKSSTRKIVIDNDIFSLETIKQVHPFFFKPNFVEFKKLVGCKNLTRRQLVEQVQEVSQYCDNILVSLGEDGAIYASQGQTYHVSTPQVQVRSTIGAGDTTLASFLTAYIDGQESTDCAKYAVAGGTASVMLDGTATITAQQIVDRLHTITIDKIEHD